MQRCPCCHARLKSEPICPRCGAELSRVLRCEQLAQAWLSVALQTLSAGQANIAVAAVKRSLSFKQTEVARIFRDFLIHQQYQMLYEKIEQKQWSDARQAVSCLRSLQGDNQSLPRFLALIEYLAVNRDDQ